MKSHSYDWNGAAKRRGIQRAEYTLSGPSAGLDSVAIDGEVKIKVEGDTDSAPTSFTDPTWFQLLKLFDDYLVKKDITDHVYFEGVFPQDDIYYISYS